MSTDTVAEPLVSIVTPTYNRSRFLLEAIDSVLAQTYQNFELLIVDDGSVDDTRLVLEQYLQDPRIRYIYQENSGQATARNNGLRHATGEFVCFLDSDDYWRADKLELSLAVFRELPEVSVVHADMIVVDENGVEISRANAQRYSGRITGYLLRDNCVAMSTTMVRRSCFDKTGGFNRECRRADDYELWLRMSLHCEFHYIRDYLAYYRATAGQISGNTDKRLEVNERIIRDFLARHPDAVTWTTKRRGLSHFYIRKANYFLSIRRLQSVIKYMLTGLIYHPFWQGPWRTMCLLFLGRSR